MLIDQDFERDEDRKEPLLIDHDFEWDEDQEEAIQTAAGALVAGQPRPISAPGLPSNSAPNVGFVIREKRRGFSRRTLALAVVALLLSVTLRPHKSSRPVTEPVIPRSFSTPGRHSLDQADPGRRPAQGLPLSPRTRLAGEHGMHPEGETGGHNRTHEKRDGPPAP
jgi:hypothetical protein